ncbi:T9SS type A sorting domain-containing protein [Candidatus Sulfidibacterium hydrothermale]|uniref:DUF7619 domain-containing protein n=1 Tax=Candidatus Sulfidibacterium hydrothermale TaxID=2875962 RepID=UPI001F0A3FF3|nr:T9SS type A sorting domain-containing protein [Candidatus Sulfidibacterium hydrothermale]UBM61583.1 T9SS type A sorting domain-containing protein [Candidatus Sulfidibacterium hydrothermale]
MASDQQYLYIGNINTIGKKSPGWALFQNGSSQPTDSLPALTGNPTYGQCQIRYIYAAVTDGNGGWYIGGDFFTVNGEKTGPLAHIRADKTVENFALKGLSFNETGSAEVFTLKKDGNFLYVGGRFIAKDNKGNYYNSIFKLNLNTGEVDPEFNPFPGKKDFNNNQIDQIETGNNKVFITGHFENQTKGFLVFDQTTGKQIHTPSTISSPTIVLLHDTLLISANSSFGYPLNTGRNGLALLDVNTDTSILPHPLFKDYQEDITSVIGDGEGGWYISTFQGIYHFTPDLEQDTVFKQKLLNKASQLLLNGDNLFVCSDQSVEVNGKTISKLFKLDARTGTIDTLFNPNPDLPVYGLTANGDTLFAGGPFYQIAGQKQQKLAALNIADGKLINWNPETEGIPFPFGNYWDGVKQLIIHDGKLYISGKFTLKNHTNIVSLARFDLQTGKVDTTFFIDDFKQTAPDITGMALYQNKLFVTSKNDLISTTKDVDNFAVIDSDKKTIRLINGSYKISFSGWYDQSPKIREYQGKIYCWHLAATDTVTRLSRTHFFSMDAQSEKLTSWNPNPDNTVNIFAASGDRMLIYGSFSTLKTLFVNNTNASSLFALNTNNFQYIPIYYPGKSFGSSYFVKQFVSNNKYIFASTDSYKYGDSTVYGLIRLSRKNLSFAPYHPGLKWINSYVSIYNIALGKQGLFVMGNFDKVGNAERKGLCLLDSETAELKAWNPPPFNLTGPNKRIFASENDSNVIVSTDYNTLLYPFWSRDGLAKIDLSTGKLSSWNPHSKSLRLNAPGNVQKIKIYGDTVVVSFQEPVVMNGKDTGSLFLLNRVTGQVIPGFHPPVCDYSYFSSFFTVTFARQGNDLFLAGDFKNVNGINHPNLVKIDFSTGKIDDKWGTPSFTSNTEINGVVVFRDTIYVYGNIYLANDTYVHPLISIDAKTGNIIKAYPLGNGNYQNITNMAVNKEGTIMFFNKYLPGIYVLEPENRDTIIKEVKLSTMASSFTAIRTYENRFILAAKNMSEKNLTTTKSGMIFYDPDNDTVLHAFTLPSANTGAEISSFSCSNDILAIGGYLCNVYGQQNTNLAFLTMPDLHLKPGITSWTPHKADNRNPFALMIYGTGFGENSSVSLFNNDTTLSPDSLFVKTNKITAWFDGTRFIPGEWNMKVAISDTLTKTFTGAIKIDEGSYTEMWAKLTGPNVVLIHKPETYYVSFGNKGNTAAFGTFLYIGVGKDQEVTFPNSEIQVPDIHYNNFDINMDTVTMYTNVDYFFGQPFDGKVYALFIPYIPAHFEYDLKIYIRSDVHGQKPVMRVAISQPLYESYDEISENLKSTEGFFSSFFHCAYDIASTVASLTPGISCIKSVFDNFIYEGYKRYVTNQTFDALSVTKSTGLVALDCSGAGTVGKAYTIATKIVQTGNGLLSISGSCDHFFKNLFQDNTQSQIEASVDPNAKFGPTGLSSSHFVTSKHPYQYLITFENDSAATAPAQRVIIIDTLDKNVFDLNTFRPLGFGFGDTNYLYRENDGDTVYIDLRPEKNALVRIFYQLDKGTGILKWTFQTLDPNTYAYVTNVNDGFLPPNRKSPEGDGNVFYSIEPLAGLPEGTTIHNQAHIIFDWNEEMATDTWNNTTDNIAPESAVNALPDKTVETSFKVSWKGSDEGSGIYAYTVFVSENDSAYYPWLVDTHDTSAVFSGQPGVTYKFYSIAVDSAGNKEPVPSIYDAKITVSGTGIETFGTGNQMQFRIYPNPAKEHFNVDYYLPESSSVRIDVLNACGHLVQLPVKTTALRGTSHVSLDISHLPAGYYFVRILTKYGVQVRKIIKQ